MTLPVTAIILTLNEELNLSACLKSLEGLCSQIFVVDSGSADQTASIAQQKGATLVQHPFETHAKQWNWALENLPVSSEWILALDADQRISPELKDEILHALSRTPSETVGYYFPRKQIFRGKWIRHGGYWPKYLLKLFRRGTARTDEQELVDFRFYVQGQTSQMRHPLIEQNENEWEILFWLQKHLRFIELRAQEEHRRRHHQVAWKIHPSLWGSPDQQTLWLKQLWYRLPLFPRPFLYFGYRYFIRLGILDGFTGSLFHFLQSFWYELMISVRLKELERSGPKGTSESP